MTVTPQATVDLGSTYEAYWNGVDATHEAIFPQCGSTLDLSYSPDGNWAVVVCMNHKTGVYSLDDPATAWSLEYFELFGEQYDDGNHFGRIEPVHWTRDSKFLYFMPFPAGLDGGCVAYADGLALFRLELSTGNVSQTLEPAGAFYDVSFSNDDVCLAYFRTLDASLILNIVTLVTGQTQQLPLGEPFDVAGDVVWSPEMDRIIFSARHGDDCDAMTGYLVMMNLDDLSQTILLESTSEEYKPIEWTADNHIILGGYYDGNLSLDLTTLEISSYVTPSPTPRP